ncbi:MAG: cobalt ECF transporter T component CbiQ [Acidobacteria bacterium]|nr:cobalt ECF transporter T component CbiQ [Acidobacteriota bacterium]
MFVAKIAVLYAALLLPAIVYKVRLRRTDAPLHRHTVRHNHGEWHSLDSLAYSSHMRGWNPTFKVLLSVLTTILCISLDNPYVSIVVLLSMAYLVVELGGLPLRDYFSVLRIPIVFIALSVLTIVVDFSTRPVGTYHLFLGLGYVYTNGAMLQKGAYLTLKVFAAISAMEMMTLTTPSDEIISVLRQAHVPSFLVDLMNMIYRFIFILQDVFIGMKNAAESRLGYGDIKTAWRAFGGIGANLLVLSLKKAGAYYDAMEARCYDGELVFLEEEKKVQVGQVIAATLFVLYLLLLWYLTK